jgi:hypothetical protein
MKDFTMNILARLSLAAAAVVSIAASAQAMPLPGTVPGPDGVVTLVRDGCGPFGHRSHYGYCKENGDGWGGYDRGGYGPGGYAGYGYPHRPGFYGDGGYHERRCFIRETYDGPVRICR